MRKAILASILFSAAIVSAILVWKYYPRSDKVEIVEPEEVIEDNALVSLFVGSSLLKGGSSSFFILGLIGLAVYYIHRKKKMRNASSPTTPSSPPLPATDPSTTRPIPMETYPFLPVSPYNPGFMSSQRAICHDQTDIQAPPATGGPSGPLSRDQIGAVLVAATAK